MRPASPIAVGGFAVCAFSAGFYFATTLLLKKWLQPPRLLDPNRLKPVTFFRPIKSGEPHIESDFDIFLDAVGPDDQVLVGTSTARESSTLKQLSIRRGIKNILFIPCAPGLLKNPKVNKLAQMEAHAHHDRWIILDSDTRPDKSFLDAFRSEWATSGADAISAPYSLTDPESIPSSLDSLGTSLSLWPGTSLLRATGRANFLTGACMGILGHQILQQGGWSILGDALAEDHELGHIVAKSCGHVHLSSTCLPVRAGRMSWKNWTSHQHRTFATYRYYNPQGTLGLPLTFGVATSFLLALARPRSSARWLIFASLLSLRTSNAQALPAPHPHTATPPNLLSVLIISLAEPIFWLAAWIFPRVRWGSTWSVNRLQKNKFTD